ncbi:uncharacterized protein LOC111045309 isoform X2 [Nilaparvata lugens]|uniref:uncharacterized protein LOC111045309 isoform X2 n=1 Tax=Nilaparvata lugens TaxID=108931 RepID=UPI00193CD19C|nr:uncharacterized protein LOC111045309 isoform X2 [Nilaparvata lugens]
MDYPGSNYSLPPAGTSQYPVPASPYPGQGATQPSYASAFNDALHMLCSIMKLNAGAPYTGAPGGVDHHAFMRANIAASEGVNNLKAIVGAPATIPTESHKSPIRDDSGLERIIAMKNASKENFFDTTVQKPCAVCGVSSPLVCIVCLEEYYCSHDCQTEAWGEHELVCRKRGTASGGQRNGHAAIESNAEHGKVSAENESNKYNGEASVSTHTTESLRRPDANMYLRPSNRKPIIRNQKQHRQQTDTKSNASDASTDSKRTMNKDNYQKPFKRNSGFNNNSYLKPNADGDNNRKPYADSENHRKSYADSDNHRKPYADSDNHRKPYSENKTNGYLKPDSDSDTCKRSIKNDVTQTKPIPQPNSTAPRKTEAASSETEVKTRIEAGMVRNVALTSAESLTDYWVSLKDDESALMCLATELSKRITDRSPGLKKASVGDWCCKAFDGCWTRARVVNAANPLTVLYVDYGNSETATIDQLRELPADLGERSFPPFAIHVTHPAGISPADADQVFPLRFISHDPQGLWTVEKARPDELTVPTKPCGQDVSFDSQMGRNEESLPPMISSPSPSCVSTASSKSPYFEEGKIYKVHLQLPLSLTEFYVTKLELKEELEKLHSELNSVVSDSSQPIQNLEVKSKCAAKYLGEWYRASVLKLDPLTVLFIDYGNEETCQPSDVKELPPKFRTRMLTARVHLTKTPTKEQIMAMDSGEPILLEA